LLGKCVQPAWQNNQAAGMSADTQAETLHQGLKKLPALADGAASEVALLDYLTLLERWNKPYNLTAVKDPIEMVLRHLLDSLSVLPWVGSGTLLDAGTGAGLPGVPLAIARPDLEVTLLDSTGKKIRFLNHVQRELGLQNIVPIQARLESFKPPTPPDRVISRAFSDLAAFARGARYLSATPLSLLAMKGRYPESELKQLPDWVTVESIEKLDVPGLQEERHLVMMTVNP
jgi:16S rRNA (guanine527-N7)-methyltransferase